MHDKFHYMRYMHRTLLLLLLLILILLVLLLHAVHALQSAAHHEGVEVGVGSAQLVHDPLDLAKAESTPLPVLPIQRHIGSIHQCLHRPVLLQPCLDHTTKCLFRVFVWEVGGGGGWGGWGGGLRLLGYTAIQRHIGPIYHVYRSMLLQPCLDHTTPSFFRISF